MTQPLWPAVDFGPAPILAEFGELEERIDYRPELDENTTYQEARCLPGGVQAWAHMREQQHLNERQNDE